MGYLDKVLGNAQTADQGEVDKLITPILCEGEKVSHAFLLGARDLLVFTNLRLIMVDKTGFTGKKKNIFSTAWKNVLSWTYTTVGTIDIDAEVTLHIRGMGLPLVVNFPKKTELNPVIKVISEHVLLNK